PDARVQRARAFGDARAAAAVFGGRHGGSPRRAVARCGGRDLRSPAGFRSVSSHRHELSGTGSKAGVGGPSVGGAEQGAPCEGQGQSAVRSRELRWGPVALRLLVSKAARVASSMSARAWSVSGADSTTGRPDSPP